MAVLNDLSQEMAATVERAGQSVVRVEGRRRMAASGIVWSADGVIITANHVVERDDNLRVGLADGRVVSATLIGRDPSTELALLRADASGLTPATWASSGEMKVGHLVLAIGRPENDIQATLGIVSALGEGYRTGMGGQIDAYLQTDVVMYPGFSGGPLVSAAGPFYGLNSSALGRGVSLTLPSSTLQRVANTLLTHGRVRRGFLGVSAQPVRLPANIAEQVSQETGLLLASVETGSPADHAGLLLGDTLIALDNQKVRQMDDLMALLSGDRVGQALAAKVLRGGVVAELSVTIGERQ